MIRIIFYGISMLLCGYFAGRLHQPLREFRTARHIDRTAPHDECIVCQNATVVQNKRGELSWYDNERPRYIFKRKEDQ